MHAPPILTPHPHTCDRPPSPADYAIDLPARLAHYRAEAGLHLGAIPPHAIAALAIATRRALHAEDLARQLRAANDLAEVYDTFDASDLPI